MRFRQILITATLLAATALPSWAATYYVAPTGAALSGTPDGTKTRPWASIGAALGRAKAGDTILLMDGNHGAIDINNMIFDSPVTIQSESGQNAHIDSAHFGAKTKNITLRNLKVWRPEGDGPGYMIRSYEGSTNLTFENLDIRSREDSINYLAWSQARWLEVSGNAVDLRGGYVVVRNNTITGVGRGIVAGSNSLVENNVIDGFSRDALRGTSGSTFRNNLVKNSFDVDDTHRDGFQSYSKNGVQGLTVEGNTIIAWTLKTSSPLRGSMQGISLFDGPYDDLIIQNNIVATSHANGIVVAGTRRAKIVNNTVVQIDGQPGKYPWIRVGKTKDGMPSQDVIVANNLAMRFLGGDTANNVVFTNNSVILYPSKVLQNLAAFDYRPKVDSGFIDTASAKYAPKLDVLNHARPYAKGPDMGAYEVGSK
jgi:hypothetical protein